MFRNNNLTDTDAFIISVLWICLIHSFVSGAL